MALGRGLFIAVLFGSIISVATRASMAQEADTSATEAATEKAAAETTEPVAEGNAEVAAQQPKLKLHDDGFPTGQSTPEGAACDLLRAFIQHDPELFRKVCIEPFGSDESCQAYKEMQEQVVASMEEEGKQEEPSPGAPKKVGKVFAARHLSLNGPASTAYAFYNFHDVMFVDVGAYLQNDERFLNRTLVVKKADGTWYVHPCPMVNQQICVGLNEEEPSTKDFTEAYPEAKPKDDK